MVGRKIGGRKKGTPNKATREARETFRMLLESNADRMQGWIDRIAKKQPARALQLLADLAEFVVPKLSRTEFRGTGEDGRLIVEVRHCGGSDGEAHSSSP